ncbi:SAM-dependent methyltransferase [Haloarchaeobius sp. HRN-SO-5]|uniref:SAM-dependent methyltransferase n=1 Tax=Haloarchaeobius sp. HRN-SO-5 TaxID=3446118 RepID=UPI003EBCA8DF
MEHDERERAYGRDEYYWGTEPNDLARRTLEHLPSDGSVTVLDVGAGEGRDAVFFAEQGHDVYAMDDSPAGLAKARRLADERGVEVRTLEADVNDLAVPEPVDVVYSVGAVQYLRPENRRRQFRALQAATTPGGVHVVFAFVDHPDVPTPPDWTENEHFYDPAELADYYSTWTTLDAESIVFEDDSGGEPHEHAAEVLFAQKPE